MIRDALRFLVEFVLAMGALFAGLGCLWIVSKFATPVLEFFVRVGL